MASFRYDNGKKGQDYCHHTSTGYECAARHRGNVPGVESRVMFYVRHVVGGDGHPYTELGFNGLDDVERQETMDQVKSSLKNSGFRKVLCLSDVLGNELCYAEHVSANPTSISVRLNAGSDGIVKAVKAMADLIHESSLHFVQEQEDVPNVLYESILYTMGREMDKSPGGHEAAVQKARQLADTMMSGFNVSAQPMAGGDFYQN